MSHCGTGLCGAPPPPRAYPHRCPPLNEGTAPMPKRPPTRCTFPTCPDPVHARGRCRSHQPAPWLGHTPDPNRPTGRAWFRLKQQIFARDNWTCYLCGSTAQEVDHILNIKRGGAAWDPGNLASICEDCHSEKTKREAREGAQRARQAKRELEREKDREHDW